MSTSPQAGATTDNVVVDNSGSFDPELAQAYSSMSSHEFKDKWYLESTMKKDPCPEEDGYSSEEDDRHFIEVWSSVTPSLRIIPTNDNEGDNSMVDLGRNSTSEDWIYLDDSSDTAMIPSTIPDAVNENTASDAATTPKAVNENDVSTSSSSPKKNPPVRRLRPRRENQVKPYTWELALHKAKIAGIEELLSADARSRREEEKHSLEDQYESDHQDDDDDDDDDVDDPMDTEDDDNDESEERIVRRGLRHMRLSEKKKRPTSSPSRSTSSPSLPSTPPPNDLLRSSGHVSLWPSHTTHTRGPTVSRVYGSKKKKHRMTKPMKSKIRSSRRRAPRIMEEDEEDNMEDDDIQQPLLEDGDNQQPEAEDEDVFAFPQHPINSPFPSATRQSGNDDGVDDIFDFPIDDDPVDDPIPTTPQPRTTHQTAMDELKRRRQGRQRTTTNDDEFVVEDTEEFKPKKRKRFNMNELPSTHGVLPRSFGIVAKRLEERPKPVAPMDDEDDNDARSTSSASESSSSADESSMYDRALKQQLLPEFFESPPRSHSASHSSPSSSSSSRQPSLSLSRTRQTNTNHASSNTVRYSSSKVPRPSNSTGQGSSDHHRQKPSKKRRRRQRNKLDGIYIHPRLDDDYLPSLPKFGRGDPSRSHIPYLPSDDDMDDMELDTNTNSRSSAQLTPTTFNSPSSASNQPFQHAFQTSPALSSSSPSTPIQQDPFEEFLKSHSAFTYDFNTTPSQYAGSLSGTRYIGRGFLANLFEQEQPLAMPATQVFGEELPMMDSSSSEDMAPAWMDYASLQRLLFKCFHNLANYIERDIGGREQDIELRKFTCIYHFLSWSIMVQGRSLPGYFEKEIECLVQRVLTLNGKRTPSKWVILMLVYYMDWKRRLHPSLNDSRAQYVLLEHLYRLGPDQVHIQVDEANITAVNIVSVEAWVTLLKFEADHGQIWHTLWTWIEEDESLPVWDKVERAWHWLFVIRVMRGFDIRGNLSKPSTHDEATWPGVPQLVTLSRELVEKWGTKYDQYAHCLRKRWRSLNAPS